MTTHNHVLQKVALGSVVASTACLHYPHALECTPAPGELACVESGRFDENGRLRAHVLERVAPGDACERVRIEQTSFDENGILLERTVDERSCGNVDRRVIDRYELVIGELVREIWIDQNHDDQLDTVVIRRVPLSNGQRALATSTHALQAERLAAARTQRIARRDRGPRARQIAGQ